jgi:hypothetical protein
VSKKELVAFSCKYLFTALTQNIAYDKNYIGKLIKLWIWGSHGAEYETGSFLGSSTVLPLTSLSCMSFSPPCGHAVVCPPPFYWLPCPHPILTIFPTGLVKVLPWLTGSYISNWFLMRGLLIVLMMEAARTSATLVIFYQTTRRNNPEDSHLHQVMSFRAILCEHCWLPCRHHNDIRLQSIPEPAYPEVAAIAAVICCCKSATHCTVSLYTMSFHEAPEEKIHGY